MNPLRIWSSFGWRERGFSDPHKSFFELVPEHFYVAWCGSASARYGCAQDTGPSLQKFTRGVRGDESLDDGGTEGFPGFTGDAVSFLSVGDESEEISFCLSFDDDGAILHITRVGGNGFNPSDPNHDVLGGTLWVVEVW